MSNLDDMLLFVQVVKQKSFRAVADQEGIASSVVSKHISRLEKRLGVQLLTRTTRKLNLTEAGEEFYDHCLQVENGIKLAELAVSEHTKEPKGKLKISAPIVSGHYFLPRVISEYLKQYPQMQVEMVIEDSFQDLVSAGFDLAIRTGTLLDSSLRAKLLVMSHWNVYASPNYLKEFGRPDSIFDLEKHNCLQFSYQETGANEWPVTVDGKADSIRITGSFQADSLVTLREAACMGIGLAFMPVYLANNQVKSGELEPVLQDYIYREVGIYVVYPNIRYVPKKISAFIEILTELYAEYSYSFQHNLQKSDD
ncbi:LysR family transcriptional regulator [Sessilibacter corallicola]|uniref:LysR family transcriptional regulator n=1 Tax=Sessilibacter corallicola TaxID=2904075 RepID=UPI001E2A6C19|nr:LysR family transcriptional regulator [Sessilibacter corallicola]MCE2028729.1 LysR family transcriptional regulator [Sessilibacter corallicola]